MKMLAADRKSLIGRSYWEADTPALILHLDRVKRNIASMADVMERYTCKLRPHIKCHKSPHLARLQLEAGAAGVTAATLWEAVAMAEHGIGDILIANQIVGGDKLAVLAELAGHARVTVAVDAFANADELSRAADRAGSAIGVLVECDIGMGRCGVRTNEEALRLAEHVARKSGLVFHGLMGYEGHCMLEPDRQKRHRKAAAAVDKLLAAADRLESSGLPVDVISSGGTGTFDMTGAHPRITELQAGSYIIMDEFHRNLTSAFSPALFVLATVISRQGNTIVLDCGRKTVGSEFFLPRIHAEGVKTAGIAEEHLIAKAGSACVLQAGDRVEVIPGYSPTTVNVHEAFYVVERAIVTDIWPICARGGALP